MSPESGGSNSGEMVSNASMGSKNLISKVELSDASGSAVCITTMYANDDCTGLSALLESHGSRFDNYNYESWTIYDEDNNLENWTANLWLSGHSDTQFKSVLMPT